MRSFVSEHRHVLAYLALVAGLLVVVARQENTINDVQTIARENRTLIQRVEMLTTDARRAGVDTRSAICRFVVDLDRRNQQTEDFIAELKAGTREPIPGISIADLERSDQGQDATIKSFENLDCL